MQYPLELDLAPFMVKRHGPAIMYDLYGVLVHLGHSVHSGHYYCYIKGPNGLWYKMDDTVVSQVGLSDNRLHACISSAASLWPHAAFRSRESHLPSAPTAFPKRCTTLWSARGACWALLNHWQRSWCIVLMWDGVRDV